MYDILIRGGDLVDGTGSARRRADVGIQGDRVVAIGDLDDERGRDHRRHRQGRHARLRRRAHALRRAGVLGRRAHAVAAARRHHRARGQLRLHHRTVVRRSRRRRLPDAHAGARRGHAARVAARGRAVELDVDRGVLRRDRGPPRDQRRVHGRPLRDPARGDGGGVHHARGEARGARGDAGAAARRARRRRARLLVVVGAHAQRRRGPHGPVAASRPATRSSSCARRWRSTRARRSSSSPWWARSSRGPSS